MSVAGGFVAGIVIGTIGVAYVALGGRVPRRLNRYAGDDRYYCSECGHHEDLASSAEAWSRWHWCRSPLPH